MHFGRLLCSLACAAACALGATGAQAQVAPTLTTDAQDYLPGEVAMFTGTGFLPGEAVDISIAIEDELNNVHIGDYDWMVELAGDTGDFVSFWTVPIEAYGMTLRATALGLTSGYVATTTFYDSHGTHNVNFRIVGMESRLPADAFFINVVRASPVTHADAAQNILVWTTGATSANVGAAAQVGTVSYGGFASAYTIPAGTYHLVSTNPPSGFASGLSGTATTVVVTYQFVPNCTATNAAPSLSASDVNLGATCPANGTVTATVTPADFLPITSDPNGDPVTLRFADGSTSQTIIFDPLTPSYTFVLRASDNPSARNQVNCPALASLSSEVVVTVSATVVSQPTNDGPVVTANDLVLGSYCVDSSITVPISVADFGAGANDADNDPYTMGLQDGSQVTLTLPPNVGGAVVTVPVVITATDDPSGRDCAICAPLTPMTGSTIVYVSAHLYRNTAPVLMATDANLGDIVGQLSAGTFIKNVAVSPALFGAAAADAEGDPFTITASVANVTLVGPGMASATVVLTATDDPSSRTGGACAAASSSVTVHVTARLVYRFQGPLFPLSDCVAVKVRRGSIVPVRFRLFDCNNVEVRTVPVNPAGGPTTHTVGVAFNQASAPDGAVDIDEISLDCDNQVDFTYLLGGWNLLLWTNSSYQVNTTYRIRMYTNDGNMHDAMISIKR